MNGPPARAGVAVVGAGLAGSAAALFLARGGARVVLLDAHDPGAEAGGAGLASVAGAEPPHRLAASVGAEAAAALCRLRVENGALLEAEGLLRRTGSPAVALGPGEPGEVEADVAALRAGGVACEAWPPERVEAELGPRAPARFQPDDGALDPAAAARALARRAAEAGVEVVVGARVVGLDEDPAGVRLETEHGTVIADAVVLAAGHALRALDPFFADKLFAVRVQRVRLPGAAPRWPGSAGRGALAWRPVAGGAVVEGCRHAARDGGAGVEDASGWEAPVERCLVELGARLRGLAPRPERRAAAVRCFTCDGLPLVGPLPGRPALVALCGWGGEAASWAVRAARAVADGLLRGRAPGVPRLLDPRRFL